MRHGVRLGVDVGEVRTGVARSDPAGVLAVPVETVARGAGDLDRLAILVAEHDVREVVVGLPVSMSGREGPAAGKARDFAVALARRIGPTPVRLVDERLSTVSAQRGFRERGLSTRRTRNRVDQAAAVIILQNALDAERATGRPPGEVVRASTDENEEERQ